jgi:hypothetical protein
MNVVVELRKGIWVDEKMKVDVFFPPGGVHNINNPRLIRANCLFPFPIVYVPIKIRVVKNTFTAVFTIIILQLSNKPVFLIIFNAFNEYINILFMKTGKTTDRRTIFKCTYIYLKFYFSNIVPSYTGCVFFSENH